MVTDRAGHLGRKLSLYGLHTRRSLVIDKRRDARASLLAIAGFHSKYK